MSDISDGGLFDSVLWCLWFLARDVFSAVFVVFLFLASAVSFFFSRNVLNWCRRAIFFALFVYASVRC